MRLLTKTGLKNGRRVHQQALLIRSMLANPLIASTRTDATASFYKRIRFISARRSGCVSRVRGRDSRPAPGLPDYSELGVTRIVSWWLRFDVSSETRKGGTPRYEYPVSDHFCPDRVKCEVSATSRIVNSSNFS